MTSCPSDSMPIDFPKAAEFELLAGLRIDLVRDSRGKLWVRRERALQCLLIFGNGIESWARCLSKNSPNRGHVKLTFSRLSAIAGGLHLPYSMQVPIWKPSLSRA